MLSCQNNHLKNISLVLKYASSFKPLINCFFILILGWKTSQTCWTLSNSDHSFSFMHPFINLLKGSTSPLIHPSTHLTFKTSFSWRICRSSFFKVSALLISSSSVFRSSNSELTLLATALFWALLTSLSFTRSLSSIPCLTEVSSSGAAVSCASPSPVLGVTSPFCLRMSGVL